MEIPPQRDGGKMAQTNRLQLSLILFYLNHILVAIQLRGELVVNKRSGDKEEDVLVVSNWVGKIWFIARGVHLIYECAEQWRIKSRRRRPCNGMERRDNISLPLLDRRMMAQLLD